MRRTTYPIVSVYVARAKHHQHETSLLLLLKTSPPRLCDPFIEKGAPPSRKTTRVILGRTTCSQSRGIRQALRMPQQCSLLLRLLFKTKPFAQLIDRTGSCGGRCRRRRPTLGQVSRPVALFDNSVGRLGNGASLSKSVGKSGSLRLRRTYAELFRRLSGEPGELMREEGQPWDS